jgi:hypothetical protein
VVDEEKGPGQSKGAQTKAGVQKGVDVAALKVVVAMLVAQVFPNPEDQQRAAALELLDPTTDSPDPPEEA